VKEDAAGDTEGGAEPCVPALETAREGVSGPGTTISVAAARTKRTYVEGSTAKAVTTPGV